MEAVNGEKNEPKPQREEDALQMGMFADMNNAVIEELKNLDVNTLTPIEALTKLYELKNKTV